MLGIKAQVTPGSLFKDSFLKRPLLLLLNTEPHILLCCRQKWMLTVSWPLPLTQVFRMDWLDLLQSKGLSRVFSNTTVQKHQFFGAQLFFIVQLSHPYMTTGKTIALTRRTFVGKVMSLFFNVFFVAF